MKKKILLFAVMALSLFATANAEVYNYEYRGVFYTFEYQFIMDSQGSGIAGRSQAVITETDIASGIVINESIVSRSIGRERQAELEALIREEEEALKREEERKQEEERKRKEEEEWLKNLLPSGGGNSWSPVDF
ncbi:MAG: hypothetical protein LBF08_00045 [Dysgonamonadaceae bacterium]|nr:hypothetical protein [Dysgonamonadaceae bacterium]